MDEYEAQKSGGKRAKSKAKHQTGSSIRKAIEREQTEELVFQSWTYNEEKQCHQMTDYYTDEFGIACGVKVDLSSSDHWKLPDLLREKAEESNRLYAEGELPLGSELVLLVELPPLGRGKNAEDYLETKTQFLKDTPTSVEEKEEFKIVKGRKGEVVVPVKKSNKQSKVSECQRMQSMKPGYDYRGPIHAYYIFTSRATNKQSLQYRCRCDYCIPEMFPPPRSEKRQNLLDEL